MEIPKGFIARSEAQAAYDRSKMSFIRDVDQARKRGDSDFLKNFIVVLLDGEVVPCAEATKEYLRANDSKKPEWYIRQSFLDSRYWKKKVKGSPARRKSPEPFEFLKGEKRKSSAGSEDNSFDAKYVQLLIETNDQQKEQIKEQMALIKSLTEHQDQANILLKILSDRLPQIEQPTVQTKDKVGELVEVDLQPVSETPPRGQDNSDQPDTEKENSTTKKNVPFFHPDLFWFIPKG